MMKNLRYYTLFLFVLLFSVSFTACKKKKEVYQTFPTPTWEVAHEDYSTSMTVVVVIPDYLLPYASDDDQLAAFAGEICRGTGDIVNGLYYVTIKGTYDDEEEIYFQYYSARNKYLYKSPILFEFESDGVYGSVDEPKTLPLSIVE